MRTESNTLGADGDAAEERPESCDFDKSAYSEKRKEIRNTFEYEDYKIFYEYFKDLKSEMSEDDLEWKCDGTWEDLLD